MVSANTTVAAAVDEYTRECLVLHADESINR